MKRKLFAAACLLACICFCSVSAEAASAADLKENYALWRRSAFYDDGMFQKYAGEMMYGANVQNRYFLSADYQLFDPQCFFYASADPEMSAPLDLYANILSGDSAFFYTNSAADTEAAAAVLKTYYPEQTNRYVRNDQNCFSLTDRNTAVLHAIQDELEASGLTACFYYNVPVYEHRKLTVPYLTGYSAVQYYGRDPALTLSAEFLQTYIDENALHCTLRTETGVAGTVYYVIPDEELSFPDHWALALRLYHDLGIVPNAYTDLHTEQAADPPKGAGVLYDVNTDTFFNAGDAEEIAAYLLREEPVQDPQAGDMNADGRFSAADLTLIKRALLAKTRPPEKELPDPPLRVLNPCLPSVGTAQIPVFAVSFPDYPLPDVDIAWLLDHRFFSPTEMEYDDYPFESVAGYLARASYGRMQLTGDVFCYTAEHPIDWYADDYAELLVEEIMTATDPQIDFSRYDADRNGILDSMVITMSDTALKIDRNEDRVPDWWPFSVEARGQEQHDGVRAGRYCVIPFDVLNAGDFVSQTAHELCHAMGLPDYYLYATETSGSQDGLSGEAGKELMDEGEGDLSACSKLLLGWLADDEVQIYSGGTQTFFIRPSANAPSCIMIPKDPAAGCLSEYFLIEYITPDANQPKFGGSGIRILHVDAEVSEGSFGPELTYCNYGLHYDKSHQKQRVLRLVNETGFYRPGKKESQNTDTVDSSTAGFRWYDENGELTLDTGLTIRIRSIHPGPFYNPESSDPSAWLSGIAEITVSDAE